MNQKEIEADDAEAKWNSGIELTVEEITAVLQNTDDLAEISHGGANPHVGYTLSNWADQKTVIKFGQKPRHGDPDNRTKVEVTETPADGVYMVRNYGSSVSDAYFCAGLDEVEYFIQNDVKYRSDDLPEEKQMASISDDFGLDINLPNCVDEI